jgi:hypothetical protein
MKDIFLITPSNEFKHLFTVEKWNSPHSGYSLDMDKAALISFIAQEKDLETLNLLKGAPMASSTLETKGTGKLSLTLFAGLTALLTVFVYTGNKLSAPIKPEVFTVAMYLCTNNEGVKELTRLVEDTKWVISCNNGAVFNDSIMKFSKSVKGESLGEPVTKQPSTSNSN